MRTGWKNSSGSSLALFGILAIVGGCQSESRDWEQATKAKSVAEYRAYLRDHPKGQHALEARTALEDLAFAQAAKEGTVAAYREFVRQYPESSRAREAFLALQKGLFGYQVRVRGVAAVEEIRGPFDAWKVKDPARDLGLILVVTVTPDPAKREFNTGQYELIYDTPAGRERRPCAGMGKVLGKREADPLRATALWRFTYPGTDPGTAQFGVLQGIRDPEIDVKLLFVVPKSATSVTLAVGEEPIWIPINTATVSKVPEP